MHSANLGYNASNLRASASPPLLESVETNFSSLVTALKELDSIRRRVSDRPDGPQILFSACEQYCTNSKRVLRSTIQSVDRFVEDQTLTRGRSPLKPSQQTNYHPSVSHGGFRPQSPNTAVNLVIKTRELLLVQKMLDHWKMYCYGQRLKQSLDKRHNEMLTHLDSAQRLAEGAKSDVHMVEEKDNRLSSELERVRANHAAAADKAVQLERQILALKQELSSVRSEGDSLKAANRRLVGMSRSRSPTMVPVDDSKVSDLKSQLDQATEELERSEYSAKQLRQDIERLQRSSSKEREQFNREMEALANEKVKLEVSLKEQMLENRFSKPREDECLNLQVRIDELEAAVLSEKHVRENAEFDNRQLRADLSSAAAELERLRSQGAKVAEKFKSAQEDVKQMSYDLKQTEELVESLQEEKRELEQQIARIEPSAIESVRKLVSMTLERDTAVEAAASANVLAKQLEVKLETVTGDLRIAQRTVEDVVAKNELVMVDRDQARAGEKMARTELDRVVRRLEDSDRRICALDAQVEEGIHQLSEMQTQRDRAREEVTRGSSELVKDLAAVREKLAAVESERARLEADLVSAKEAVSRTEIAFKRVEELNQELKRKASEFDHLENESKLVLSARASAQELLVLKEAELAEVRAALAAAKLDTAPMVEKVALLEQQLVERDLQRSVLKDELAHAESEIDRLRTEVKLRGDLSEDAERLRGELAVKTEAERHLTAQIDLLDKDLVAAENEIEELNARVAELQRNPGESNEVAMALLSTELANKTTAEAELRARVEEVEATFQGMERRIAALDAERAVLTEDLGQAEELLDTNETATDQLKEEIATVKKQLADAVAECRSFDGIKAERDSLLQEKSKLEVVVSEMKSVATSSDHTLQNMLNEKEFELGELRSAVEAITADLERARAEQSQRKGELEASQKLVKEKMREMSDLSETLELVNAELSSRADRIDQLEREVKVVKERQDKEGSEEVAALNARVEELASELSEAKARVSASLVEKAQSDRLEAEFKTQLSLANAELLALQKQIEERRTRLAVESSGSLAVQIFPTNVLEELVASLERSVKQAEGRQVELMDERVRLEQEIGKLKEQARSSEELKGTIEKLADEKVSLANKLERLEVMLSGRLVAPASGLTLQALSELVAVDSTTGVAKYAGPNKDGDMSGCLITSTPVPMFPDVGTYFEIQVSAVSVGNPDGLTVGFTLTPPWHGAPVPNTLDDIPQSWSVGYNGQSWNSAKAEWKQIGWCGKDLTVGQRVGVLLTLPPLSQLVVFVDDVVVCKGPARLPPCTDYPFYGLVDLLGNCDGVTLLSEARPPRSANELNPIDPRRLSTSLPLPNQLRLPSRRSANVTPIPVLSDAGMDSPDTSIVGMSPKRPAMPKLSLKPTAELGRPVRPPSIDSEESFITR